MQKIAVMSVSLPKNLKEFVKQQAKQENFGTPSDYIRSLIREDLKRGDQERLEKMLLEGMASGMPEVMSPQKWAKLGKEVKKRLK